MLANVGPAGNPAARGLLLGAAALNNGMMLGLGMGLLGVAMLVLGYRQKNRTTYGEVPLTSWHFKMFFGGAFAIIAVNIIFFSLTGK